MAAGVKQQLESDMARHPGLRLLPERFKGSGRPWALRAAAARTPRGFAGFVEGLKAAGFIQQALDRHGIQGASLAPAAA